MFVNKEKQGLTTDIVFTLLSKNTPFFQEKTSEHFLNVDFLTIMNFQENEMAFFLSYYYKESPSLRYTNMDKVCRIKEIDDDSDDEDLD